MAEQENTSCLHVAVVSQLMACLHWLGKLSDNDERIHYACQELAQIPGVESARFGPEIAGNDWLPCHPTPSAGTLDQFQLRLSNPSLFEPHADLVQAFCTMAAALLQGLQEKEPLTLAAINRCREALGDTKSPPESGPCHAQAEAPAQSDHSLLQHIIQLLPQAIFWKDTEGRYLGCNESFARSAGVESPSVIIGKTDFDLPWPKAEAEAYRADDQGVIREKREKRHIIEPLQQADGSRLWIDTTKIPIIDNQGRVYGVLGIFHDITEQTLTEQSQARFRYSIEHAMDAVYWIDRNGRFTYVNEQACRSLGYTREELLKLSIWDIDFAFPKTAWEHNWARFQEGYSDGICIETSHTRKDKSSFPVEVVANYMDFGGQVLHVTFVRDLTERKAAEKFRRTKEFAERLKDANTALKTANQELESFSYSISHDLRAPLRNISGFVDLLRKRLGETSDATTKRQLDVIASETKRMGELISDLLAFSKINTSKLEHAPVDLTQLVHAVRDAFANDLSERAIEWRLHPLPAVIGDISLLRQVLSNLIDNAIKFTRDRTPGIIEIGSSPAPPQAGQVEIFVRDNGAGFDPSQAKRLFGVFQRLHTQRDFEGTGIGLANVKRIITRHGGQVWAEGLPGKGACFHFTLPSSTSALPRKRPAPEASSEL